MGAENRKAVQNRLPFGKRCIGIDKIGSGILQASKAVANLLRQNKVSNRIK
jgi:hypothetical protein